MSIANTTIAASPWGICDGVHNWTMAMRPLPWPGWEEPKSRPVGSGGAASPFWFRSIGACRKGLGDPGGRGGPAWAGQSEVLAPQGAEMGPFGLPAAPAKGAGPIPTTRGYRELRGEGSNPVPLPPPCSVQNGERRQWPIVRLKSQRRGSAKRTAGAILRKRKKSRHSNQMHPADGGAFILPSAVSLWKLVVP